MRPLRVLVADDCQDTTDTTADLVGLWGHDARRAYGGAEALRVAADFRPDLLVVDLGLPGVDGFEVARRVRQLPGLAATLLIAVTGHTGDGYRRRAGAAGFEFYLLKPVDPFTLEALLMNHQVERSAPPAAAAPSAEYRILVVDDDDGVRRFLAAGLPREGFAVSVAASGPEAADLLRACGARIDAVLMDVQMPGRDGPASLAALREQDPALQCCFMSGDPGGYAEDDLRKLGTGEVLRKPFTLAEAGRVLRAEIRRRDCEEAAQDDHWRDDGGQGQRPEPRGPNPSVDDRTISREILRPGLGPAGARPMVRMQWVACPVCGHGHTFSLTDSGAVARDYGYVCPETGRPASMELRGQWTASEHPAQGAVVLVPLAAAAEPSVA